jgi:hypothetical protein
MFIFLYFYSNSQSDEENETETDDNFDKHNRSEIYNLSEILSETSKHYISSSSPTTTSHHHHHHSIDVNEEVKDEKQKTKRYYIYSHTTIVNDTNIDNDELMNRDEKSRKIRSSLQPNRKQISRNISLVLENLLKSYENSQLPTHGQGLCKTTKKFSFFFDVLIKLSESQFEAGKNAENVENLYIFFFSSFCSLVQTKVFFFFLILYELEDRRQTNMMKILDF